MTKSRTSNSSVCRVHKNANYTVMSNYHLQSRNLSLKAIGLLSKVFSLPDDWDYSIAGLTCICKENETAIKSALNELKEWGYLTVTKLMPSETKSGRIEYVYDFYEYSKKDTASGTSSSTPKVHKEKQDIENLPLEITEINSRTKLYIYKSSSYIYRNPGDIIHIYSCLLFYILNIYV